MAILFLTEEIHLPAFHQTEDPISRGVLKNFPNENLYSTRNLELVPLKNSKKEKMLHSCVQSLLAINEAKHDKPKIFE